MENPYEEKNSSYELKKKKRISESKIEAQPAIPQMFDRVTIVIDDNCLLTVILYCFCSEDSSHITLTQGVYD